MLLYKLTGYATSNYFYNTQPIIIQVKSFNNLSVQCLYIFYEANLLYITFRMCVHMYII